MNQPDEESTCFVVARAQMTARYSFATEWHLRCLFLSISQLSGQEKESLLCRRTKLIRERVVFRQTVRNIIVVCNS